MNRVKGDSITGVISNSNAFSCMLWVAEAKGPHPDPAYDEFLSVIVDFQGIYIYLHKIQLNEKLKKKEKECRIFFSEIL